MDIKKEYITTEEARKLLNLKTRSRIRQLVREGKLEAEKIGGVYLVKLQSVFDYAELRASKKSKRKIK